MRTVLAVLVLLGCSTAFAGINDPTWNPPTRFDHPYSGAMTVRHLPQEQVVSACAKLFARYKVAAKSTMVQRGCSAITSKTSCTVIVIDRAYKLATPKAVLRHETGHCNGWAADHPN